MTAGNFSSRLAQASLASKNDTATLVKKTDLDDKPKEKLIAKVTSSKTKHAEAKKNKNNNDWFNKHICTNIKKRIWFSVR